MKREIRLPALSEHIDNIHQEELRRLLATAIRISQGRAMANYSLAKPTWWPKGLAFTNPRNDPRDGSAVSLKPWTEVLRNAIKNCYKYHGQEGLLAGRSGTPQKGKNSSVTVGNSPGKSSRRESSPLKAVNNQQTSVKTTDSAIKPKNSSPDPPFQILPSACGSACAPSSPRGLMNVRDGSPVRFVSWSRNTPTMKTDTRSSSPLRMGKNSGASSDSSVSPQHASRAPNLLKALTTPLTPMLAASPTRLFHNTSTAPSFAMNKRASPRNQPASPRRRSSRRLAVLKKTMEQDNSFMEIFICFFCEKEFKEKLSLQDHQRVCSMRPPQLKVVDEACRLPVTPIRRPPRLWLESPDSYNRPNKKVFVLLLGLLPQSKAEALENQKRTKKVDCDVIDIDQMTPKTPTTPRTPKSLMSQLSREVSPPTRRSLSLSDKPHNSSIVIEDEDSEPESESSKSDESSEGDFLIRRTKSLYTIDITSPLGDRVKKHMSMPVSVGPDFENNDRFCGNYDQFCQTPEKNLQDRLRSRGSGFPVSFKKTRRTDPKHFHLYKFTKKQRLEHYRTLDTGLNRQSRALKRSMRKCSVHLHRLSQKEIDRWTCVAQRRPSRSFVPLTEVDFSTYSGQRPQFSDSDLDAEDAVFPGGPGLLCNPSELQRLLGLKTKTEVNVRENSPAPALELSQVVSEDLNAEVNEQKVIVYRTVLSELSRKLPVQDLEVAPGPSVALHINTDFSTDLTPPSTPDDQSSDDDDVRNFPPGLYRSRAPENSVQSSRPNRRLATSKRSGQTALMTCNKPSNNSVALSQQDNATAQNTSVRSAKNGAEHLNKSNSVKPTREGRNIKQKREKSTATIQRKTDSGSKTHVKKGDAQPVLTRQRSLSTSPVLNRQVSTTSPALTKHSSPALTKRTSPVLNRQGSVTPATSPVWTKHSSPRSVLTRRGSASPAASTRSQLGGSRRDSYKAATIRPRTERKVSTRQSDGRRISAREGKASQAPMVQPRKARYSQEDVISISSSDTSSDTDCIPTKGRGSKRSAEDNLQRQRAASKKARLTGPTSTGKASLAPVLLFKCNLCNAEIACKDNFKNYIVQHFADAHSVRSIHLVEQKSASGEMVLSIVEDTGTPTKKPLELPKAPPVAKKSAAVSNPEGVPLTQKFLSRYIRSQKQLSKQRSLDGSDCSPSPSKRSPRLLKRANSSRGSPRISPRSRLHRALSQPTDVLSWAQ